ncbi:MAG TPA: hypothetical protein VFR07_04535, partial [Mycobacteriales bacterium]|nr:hypothetical protein [Mycobacteriales bacterium]
MRAAMSACRRTATAVVLALVVLLLPGVVSVAVAADTTPPGPVTALTAASGAGKLTLRWKNPAASDLSGVLLVRKTGTTPPTSATDGTQVARVAKPAVTYADTLLDANTAYAYALFAYDSSGNRSVRTTVSARTAVQPPAVVRLSGTLAASVVLTPTKGRLFVLESLTVPAGRTLTLGAGTTTKVRLSVAVAGALRTAGTPAAPAVVTSYYDDSIAGNTDGTVEPVVNNQLTIALRSGGTVALTGAQLHWGRVWNYDVARDRTATATLTDSALLDFSVELAYSPGQTVSLLGNTFTRAN